MPDVTCERCGQPADAERIDVSTFGELPGSRWLWGRIVRDRLVRAVLPPDEPGKLTRQDRLWIRRQQRLAEEFGRVERALREAM